MRFTPELAIKLTHQLELLTYPCRDFVYSGIIKGIYTDFVAYRRYVLEFNHSSTNNFFWPRLNSLLNNNCICIVYRTAIKLVKRTNFWFWKQIINVYETNKIVNSNSGKNEIEKSMYLSILVGSTLYRHQNDPAIRMLGKLSQLLILQFLVPSIPLKKRHCVTLIRHSVSETMFHKMIN